MKKPIIVPRFGEFESILLHNYDALLYSFSEELVDLIEDLNKNKQLRLKLGANAYEKFKNDFDPQKQIRKLQEIIAYDSD